MKTYGRKKMRIRSKCIAFLSLFLVVVVVVVVVVGLRPMSWLNHARVLAWVRGSNSASPAQGASAKPPPPPAGMSLSRFGWPPYIPSTDPPPHRFQVSENDLSPPVAPVSGDVRYPRHPRCPPAATPLNFGPQGLRAPTTPQLAEAATWTLNETFKLSTRHAKYYFIHKLSEISEQP